jgi:CRP/FNR family transcriptional regulator, cyclic AMP receptor protein
MAARFTPDARTICLLETEPAFAQAIEDEDSLPQARRALSVPTVKVPNGAFDLNGVASRHGDNALLLVLDGALARDVQVLDRTTTQLFGPGDVIAAGRRDPESLNARVSFHSEPSCRVALLEGRFHAAARVWPGLATIVQQRLAAQGRRLAIQAAILALPRVESRVLAVLWHLADTFGKVQRDGVLVPLPLTHERLGRLVGAHWPTVTLALRRLGDAGDAVRVPEGWMLRAGSAEQLAVDDAIVVAAAVA